MRIVLAGSHEQFRRYCDEQHWDDRRDALCISSLHDMRRLMGKRYDADNVYIIGTFWDLPGCHHIMRDVQSRIMNGSRADMHEGDASPYRRLYVGVDLGVATSAEVTGVRRGGWGGSFMILGTRGTIVVCQEWPDRQVFEEDDLHYIPPRPARNRVLTSHGREHWEDKDAGTGVLISELLGPECP